MNPFEILKNKEALKSQYDDMQKRLSSIEAEGSSGGRMVTVKVNGKYEMVDIKLDPICVDKRDVKMLEDLIVAAYKSAAKSIEEKIQSQAQDLASHLDLSKVFSMLK